MEKKFTMDELVAFLKNQGYVFQGSEIYGGLANAWDYGPLGVELLNNIKKMWWKKFVQESKTNVGLDASILMNSRVWVASGHVGGFSDPLIDCKSCGVRYRADKLIEDFTNGKETGDGWSNEKLMEFVKDNQIPCPDCGKSNWTDIHLKWLRSLKPEALYKEILDEYLMTYTVLSEKIERLDMRIEELAREEYSLASEAGKQKLNRVHFAASFSADLSL